NYATAQAGTKYDIGGGALLTVLGPTEPPFIKDNMKTGGNEANANSIVVRLDYGSFSMLLTGDAEEQTEHRMLSKEANVEANVLKVAHHGSKYATAADFLQRVKPQIAIISCGEWNRYSHPAQAMLDRLRLANPNIKLFHGFAGRDHCYNQRQRRGCNRKDCERNDDRSLGGPNGSEGRLIKIRLHRLRRFWAT